jgi:hypothetical protein
MGLMGRYLLAALTLGILPLQANINSVIVKWTPALCQASCVRQLENRFSNMAGVANLTIDQGNGVMELKWKKNAPFSYTDLNWTMRWIGLSMTYVRVKATGRILKSGSTYILESKHDKTRFTLLGIAIPEAPSLSIQANSIFTRPLSASNIELLENAIHNQLLVTIDGPLFQPWRSPPLWLVMEEAAIKAPPFPLK